MICRCPCTPLIYLLRSQYIALDHTDTKYIAGKSVQFIQLAPHIENIWGQETCLNSYLILAAVTGGITKMETRPNNHYTGNPEGHRGSIEATEKRKFHLPFPELNKSSIKIFIHFVTITFELGSS
jgi:hypothetical protein